MTTHFAAYLDDQDLIRMEGGESVTAFLPFTLTSGSKTIELLPTEDEKNSSKPPSHRHESKLYSLQR